MTPDELEKVAARLAKPFSEANHSPYPYTIESFEAFLLTELRAVHDAAIEEAANVSAEYETKIKRLIDMGIQADVVPLPGAIRALKIGDGK